MRRLSAWCGSVAGVAMGLGAATTGFAALAAYDVELNRGRFFPGVNFHLADFQTIFGDSNTTARDVDLTSGVLDFDFLNPALDGRFSYDTDSPATVDTGVFAAYIGTELAVDVLLPNNGLEEVEGESIPATILQNNPRISVSQGTFNHNINISSSFEPFANTIALDNLDTPTVTVDLLNDSQFVAEAPGLPSLSAFPVRLTHPATMDLEVTSFLIRDNSMTALSDRELPARIDLADYPDSVFIIQFKGDMGVAVDLADYDSQEEFDLAAQWINDNLESIEARAVGNYDIASITGGVTTGLDPRVPFLPDTTDQESGAFIFNLITVARNTPWFFDPVVAIGYDYEVSEGPLIVEVTVLPVGDQTEFLISVPGLFEDQPISANVPFDITGFAPDGVDMFTISGIDPEAELDPTDPTAFVTGLTFAEDGVVSLSMTPITVVPEPASLALVGLGIAAMIRRKR